MPKIVDKHIYSLGFYDNFSHGLYGTVLHNVLFYFTIDYYAPCKMYFDFRIHLSEDGGWVKRKMGAYVGRWVAKWGDGWLIREMGG